MRRPIRFLPMVALLIAGCGAETITATGDTRRILPTDVTALVSGPRLLEVHGAPPDGSAPAAIAATLRVPGARNDRPFTVVDRGASQRLVLEFGTGAGGRRACVQPTGSTGGTSLLMAITLCDGDRSLSTVTVRSETISGASDPSFARMMDRTMLSLLEVEQRRTRDN